VEAQTARCLGDDTILSFAQGLVENHRAEEVRVHLDVCDECRALVAEAGRAIYDDASGNKTALERPLFAPNLAPGKAIDRYIICGVIGQGGMGIVYSAFDPQLRRKVAVKLLRPDSDEIDASGASRLLREAQAMAQLSHPNVVQVYDLGVAGNQVFVAMEYVDGVTLRDWLAAEPRTLDQILDAFAWAGLGLSAAHAAGIVHRDFKTSNVLLSADGRVRVTDFGLARGIREASADPAPAAQPRERRPGDRMFVTVTEVGAMIGTPAYMAPETFAGTASDARADQFTFCAALFEALHRVHPFADGLDTSMPSLLGTLSPAPFGSAVPPAVQAVLERGLARDPAARFAGMAELLQALEGARAATPRRAIAGRIPLLALVLGCALGALALVLWLIVDRAPAPAPPRAPVTESRPPAPAFGDQPTAVVVDAPDEKPEAAEPARPGERARKGRERHREHERTAE
jgi:predicted Ser/Thr protein kinase